jgi:hypothetical protein
MSTNKNISTTEKTYEATVTTNDIIEVEQHLTEVLGRYTVDANISIRELVQNAIGAIKLAKRQNPSFFGLIDIRLDIREDGTHLLIANNGIETTHATVLRLGKSSQLTAEHQRGTGFKTAVFGLNKSNDAGSWKLFLKNNGTWSKTQAPYATRMPKMQCTVDELARIPEWATVCIDVLLEDPSVMEEVTAEELGYQFAWNLTLLKTHITYCGKLIEPSLPTGTVKYAIDTTVDVMGVPHHINALVVDAKTADINDMHHALGENSQGLHLYANGVFMNHYGMGLFKKRRIAKNAAFKDMFLAKVHPELNRVQISLNIDTPDNHALELPVNNFKSDAKWSSDIGMAYIDAINNLVVCYRNNEDTLSAVQDENYPTPVTLVEYVRLSKRAYKEAGHRQALEATFGDIEEGNFYMFPECSVSAPDIKCAERSRADLLLVKEVDENNNPKLETTTTTIEYKAGTITPVRVMNAIAYYELLAMNYNADPAIRLYGSGISTEAKRLVKRMVEQRGYRIKCIHWKDRAPLWARHMWQD